MSWLIVPLLALAAAAALSAVALRAWRRFHGKQVVTCPETGEKVTVKVDLARTAQDSLRPGTHHLRLKQCTHWPERADCHQLCVGQIESDPRGCHYHSLLGRWYQDKRCAVCRSRFEQIHWHDHKPALMDSEGKTTGWEDLPPEQLIAKLPAYQPVCWNCQVSREFRERFGDLVTDRDWR